MLGVGRLWESERAGSLGALSQRWGGSGCLSRSRGGASVRRRGSGWRPRPGCRAANWNRRRAEPLQFAFQTYVNLPAGCQLVSQPTVEHHTSCPHGDLAHADLRAANLTGADLSGAKLCHTTMPDGAVNDRGC